MVMMVGMGVSLHLSLELTCLRGIEAAAAFESEPWSPSWHIKQMRLRTKI